MVAFPHFYEVQRVGGCPLWHLMIQKGSSERLYLCPWHTLDMFFFKSVPVLNSWVHVTLRGIWPKGWEWHLVQDRFFFLCGFISSLSYKCTLDGCTCLLCLWKKEPIITGMPLQLQPLEHVSNNKIRPTNTSTSISFLAPQYLMFCIAK